MIEATSCGGVVIFRGKILVLYKNYKNKYEGWVLPKGTVEAGEDYKETALREVKEETGVSASIIKYIGKSQYTFNTPQDVVEKDVHWYLMMADSYYSKPQREEYFVDSGYYKYHEAYHLLKFSNEKQILEKAYNEYLDLKKANLWGSKKYCWDSGQYQLQQSRCKPHRRAFCSGSFYGSREPPFPVECKNIRLPLVSCLFPWRKRRCRLPGRCHRFRLQGTGAHQ